MNVSYSGHCTCKHINELSLGTQKKTHPEAELYKVCTFYVHEMCYKKIIIEHVWTILDQITNCLIKNASFNSQLQYNVVRTQTTSKHKDVYELK